MPVSCISMNISRSRVVGTGPRVEGGSLVLSMPLNDSEQDVQSLNLSLLVREMFLTIDIPTP